MFHLPPPLRNLTANQRLSLCHFDQLIPTKTLIMESVYRSHGLRIRQIATDVHRSTKLRVPELLMLISYPFTILLGQLLYHTSPAVVTNYYTNKHNLLNQLFVKRGWGWTLALTGYFFVQHGRITVSRMARLALGTLWWVLFTQWCFGLPLMDRVFLWTGGLCQYDTVRQQGVIGDIGSVVCRKIKGHWIGGHDPSGHVFLLVHSSLIMWFELVEFGVSKELSRISQEIQTLRQRRDGKFIVNVTLLFLKSSTVLLIGLLCLWWWMLLITSTHFHSFTEKLSGLIAGYIGLLIYMVPRFL